MSGDEISEEYLRVVEFCSLGSGVRTVLHESLADEFRQFQTIRTRRDEQDQFLLIGWGGNAHRSKASFPYIVGS